MNRIPTRVLVATVAVLGGLALSATAAMATTTFAHHVEIYSGNHWAGTPYVGAVTAVSVQSYGTAYSGTWINNTTGTGGTRVSADAYCNTPGCLIQIGWPGPKPNGYGTAHNHGNASPSYFEGVID
jgi:hypothetical protein